MLLYSIRNDVCAYCSRPPPHSSRESRAREYQHSLALIPARVCTSENIPCCTLRFLIIFTFNPSSAITLINYFSPSRLLISDFLLNKTLLQETNVTPWRLIYAAAATLLTHAHLRKVAQIIHKPVPRVDRRKNLPSRFDTLVLVRYLLSPSTCMTYACVCVWFGFARCVVQLANKK